MRNTTDKGYQKLMATGPIHRGEVRRLVFDVLSPAEVKALKHLTSLNAGLLGGEVNLGSLARRTRKRAMHQPS